MSIVCSRKVRILSPIGHNRRKFQGTKCIGNYRRLERLGVDQVSQDLKAIDNP